MPSLMRVSLPAHAVEKLMHGYRNGDPIWLAIMQEFGILAIQPEDERALSTWEDEGGI